MKRGLTILLMMICSFLSTHLHAQGSVFPDLMWEWLNPTGTGCGGEQIIFLGDINPASTTDDPVIVTSRTCTSTTTTNGLVTGSLVALNARTGAQVYSITAPLANAADGPEFGYRMVTGKDLNGDGVKDFAVASRDANYNAALGQVTGNGIGHVWIYSGANGALIGGPFSGANNYAQFGSDMAMGDLDGDGINEVIIGEPNYGYSAANPLGQGRVVIYKRQSSGSWTTRILTDTPANHGFGTQVASCDLNGDGKDELLVVGSSLKVFTWNPLTQNFDLKGTTSPTGNLGNFSSNVTCANLDGDTTPEIIVSGSVPGFSLAQGAIAIYNFNYSTGTFTLRKTIIGNPQSDFGLSSLIATDFDGDGYDDLVVASPGGYISAEQGKIRVFYGPSLTYERTYSSNFLMQVKAPGNPNTITTTSYPGRGLAVGDGDGDGHPDLYIGEYYYPNFHPDGRVIALRSQENFDSAYLFGPNQLADSTLSLNSLLTPEGKLTSSSATASASLSIRHGYAYRLRPLRLEATVELAANALPNSTIAKWLINNATGGNLFRAEVRNNGGTSYVTVEIHVGASTSAAIASAQIPIIIGNGARFGLIYNPLTGNAQIVDRNSAILANITPTGSNSLLQAAGTRISLAIETTNKALLSQLIVWDSEEDNLNPQGVQYIGLANGKSILALLKPGAFSSPNAQVSVSYNDLIPLSATGLGTFWTGLGFFERVPVNGSSSSVYYEHIFESAIPAWLPNVGGRHVWIVRPSPIAQPNLVYRDACTAGVNGLCE